MKRAFLAAVFQLLAVAVITLSLKPRVDLVFYENSDHRHNAYLDGYWNYFMIRSWLVLLAGIGIGLILFWISSRIKTKEVDAQNAASATRFSIGRIAVIIGLACGTILACACLPGLPGFFGKTALDYQMPMDVSPAPASGMVFMVMSNELSTPHVNFRPPDIGTNH